MASIAAAAAACAAAIGQAILGVTLMCPHCDQSPVLGGQGAALWEIDHCAKCYYWLQNPRRGIGT